MWTCTRRSFLGASIVPPFFLKPSDGKHRRRDSVASGELRFPQMKMGRPHLKRGRRKMVWGCRKTKRGCPHSKRGHRKTKRGRRKMKWGNPLFTERRHFLTKTALFCRFPGLNPAHQAPVGGGGRRRRGLRANRPGATLTLALTRPGPGTRLAAMCRQPRKSNRTPIRRTDKLTPSLLARAFAGKLVPQNAVDEPAEKLLKRICTGGKS
jgi:hypothetical protein